MALSFANRFNADLLDENYTRWRRDPASVDSTWSAFFEGFELGSAALKKTAGGGNGAVATAPAGAQDSPLQTRVDGLVYAYRTLGHTIANLDPLAKIQAGEPAAEPAGTRLQRKDLDLTVSSKFFLGGQPMKLREMIAALERIYCGHIGAEFMHIQNPRVRNWVRDRIETRPAEAPVSAEMQWRMLRTLMKVEGFEHFLHTKYKGQKRFSLEGGESLMIILYAILDGCPSRGVEEIVMGMAHRGRLRSSPSF